MTSVSTTGAEAISRVKWIVLVSRGWYKCGPLKVIVKYSRDGIGWKTRVKFASSRWPVQQFFSELPPPRRSHNTIYWYSWVQTIYLLMYQSIPKPAIPPGQSPGIWFSKWAAFTGHCSCRFHESFSVVVVLYSFFLEYAFVLRQVKQEIRSGWKFCKTCFQR